MKRLWTALSLILSAGALLGVDKVPEFEITDTYATGPTMLVRAGADGQIKEIWSGMDAGRMRHVPLFLETAIYGQVRSGDRWLDLRSLKYHHAGTRPGTVRLQSDDGLVSIEITSRKSAALCPMFVKYSFSRPVDLRLVARFKYPDFTEGFRSDDAAGCAEFETAWRGENAVLTTTKGPRLILASQPAGTTLAIDRGGVTRQFGSAREVLLCIDATERAMDRTASGSYAASWVSLLGGTGDSEEELVPGRVTLETGDRKLDRMFAYSIDAVASGQFASGDVIADEFFYRDSWLRDGTYSMIGLSLAGDARDVDRYFAFWSAQRDFSVGGEREAQQPAIAITGMWFHSLLSPEGTAFLGRVWPYVSYYADYFAGRIAKEGMLNVAEEWICFIPAPSSWPNAEIYSGLRAAAKIAARLGHPQEAGRWNGSADRLQRQFSVQAYDSDKGRLIPMAGAAGQSFADPDYPKAENRNGPLRDDRVDAGMLIIGRMEAFGRGQGIMQVDDPRFASTQAQITRDLENPDHSIFRFGPNPGSPHAPRGEPDTWPIIMAWAAQDEWLLGRTDLAWRYLLSGIVNKKGYDAEASCYYLPENWDRRSIPDKPLITWSHGDFVTSVLLLLLGVDLEPDGADLGLAPSLPPGVDHAHVGNFHFRDWRLDIGLSREGGLIAATVRPANPGAAGKALSVRLPSGRVIGLGAGRETRFTADPAQYYLAFGRSRNAAQRASVISTILAGRQPAQDPRRMTPAEIEAFICSLESSYIPTAR
jgi:hypothetical protein